MGTIEVELLRIRRIMWASLLITLPSAIIIFFSVSRKLKDYVGVSHEKTMALAIFDIFFYVILPVVGFLIFVYARSDLYQFERFKRHERSLDKLRFLGNCILVYFIALLIKVTIFLVASP
jgi:hypothetical protein